MDEQIPTFLAVTGVEDEAVAKQYLSLTNGDLEYAVTLFMEAGGAGAGSSSSAPIGTGHDSDEEMAQRLQQEAYQDQEVREADANVHRHEQLVDHPFGFGLPQIPQSRPTDIFGSAARGGIFNQRFDPDENQYYNSRQQSNGWEDPDDSDDDDEDDNYEDANDDEIMEIDSDGEEIARPARERPISRRRRLRDERTEELNATQRRLAELFRPPFDLIAPINIDTAKQQAKSENKWILINIQDATDFKSQVLNRDFWSKPNIKAIVKENFIFLQYHHDSPNGVNYTNFYTTDELPHVAILDPLTGERVLKWKDGDIPNTDTWVEDVKDFLSKFSLHPDSKNPTVKHETAFDPDVLSEEQQIEYAMKQSMLESGGNSASNAIPIEDSQDENGEPEEDVDDGEVGFEEDISREQSTQPKQPVEAELDPFEKIKAQDHEEPTTGTITRIQIRFPNGKRLVHKFLLSDTILQIFQWLKFILSEKADEFGLTPTDQFTLSNTSVKSFKFIDSLDVTVEQAGLRNASILLEKE
ncbi:hypothetical protein DFJ63DRAFT_335682 [Scheffersomyces coipomensis]|uniref:uncharacterized protein n=1 Tax=Scheffersomyces coipomensis TaxID=1788519 RepID=UPI00315C7AB3